MTQKHGKFVWHDLMTTDIEAAEGFYTSVMGWSAADSGMAHQKYVLFSQGSIQVAGLVTIPEENAAAGATPAWAGHIGVDDVDEYVEKVTAAGGKVKLAPQEIPSIGRFAVVEDPHGAAFVLFKGPSTPPVVEPNTPGFVGWNELHAGDLATEWPFYESLFGWTKLDDIDMGPMGVYRLFAPAGETSAIGGMMTKMPDAPHPFWMYYVNVSSVAAAIERAKAAGGQLLMGPHQVPGGQWIAQLIDSQGALTAVVSLEP